MLVVQKAGQMAASWATTTVEQKADPLVAMMVVTKVVKKVARKVEK